MDPKANLKEQLEIAQAIQKVWDREDTLDGADYRSIADHSARLAELVLALDEWRRKGGFDPYQKQEQELSEERSTALIELLWPVMKKDPEHKDRVQTGNGWGTKTKVGLIACIQRIVMGEPRR